MAFIVGHAMLADFMRRIENTNVQDSITPYLLQRLVDHQPSESRQSLDQFLRSVVFGPFNVHRKVLILGALLGQPKSFEGELNVAQQDPKSDPASEYTFDSFHKLSEAFQLTRQSTIDGAPAWLPDGTPFYELVDSILDKMPKEKLTEIYHSLQHP